MKTLYILTIIIITLFTGCSSKKIEYAKPQIKYIYKTKYLYLPCKKPDENKTILPININSKAQSTKKPQISKKDIKPKPKKLPIKKPHPIKIQQFKKLEIFAPKRYTKRAHQKMNFMVGINKDLSKFIYMEGEFDSDTYKNFLKFKNTIDKTIKELKIDSDGGLISSAMKIGTYIKKHHWNTGVDDEMHCYSACGFVYFAGKKKSLQGRGTIGLHRPYRLHVKDTAKSIQKTKREFVAYWRSIHAPMDVYYEMMDVDRDNLFILDKNNIEDYVDVKIEK